MDLTSSVSSFNSIRSSDDSNRTLPTLSPSLLVPTHYLTLNTVPQQPYRIADMNPYNYNNVIGTQLSVHDPSLQLSTTSETTSYAPTTSRRRFVDILNDIRARREQQQVHEEIALQRQQQQYYNSSKPVIGRPPMYSVVNTSSFAKPEGVNGLSPPQQQYSAITVLSPSTYAVITQHPPPQPLTRTTMVVVPSATTTTTTTLPVPFANITECPTILPIALLPPIHHHQHKHSELGVGDASPLSPPPSHILEKIEPSASTSASPSKGKRSHDLQTPTPIPSIQHDNCEKTPSAVSTSPPVPSAMEEASTIEKFFKNPTPPASPRHKRAKTSEECCDDKEEKKSITPTTTLVDANVHHSASSSNEVVALSAPPSPPTTGSSPVVRLISIQLLPFALADELSSWNATWSNDPVYFGDIMARPSVRARTVIAFLPELPIYLQSPVRQAGGITIEQLRSCFLIRRMRSKPANAASRARDEHQLAWIERIEVAQYRAHAHAAHLCTTPHCRAHFSNSTSAGENDKPSDLQEHVDTLFAIVFTEAAIRKLCGMRYLLRHFTDGQLFLVERFNE